MKRAWHIYTTLLPRFMCWIVVAYGLAHAVPPLLRYFDQVLFEHWTIHAIVIGGIFQIGYVTLRAMITAPEPHSLTRWDLPPELDDE